MASIQTLVNQSYGLTTGGSRYRWFGGTKTSPRRAKCLAYAWREHRRLGRPGPYFFTVTHSSFRNPKTGKAQSTRGAGQVIGFVTEAERTQGIRYLKTLGYTSFTAFHDVNARFALQIAKVEAPLHCQVCGVIYPADAVHHCKRQK